MLIAKRWDTIGRKTWYRFIDQSIQLHSVSIKYSLLFYVNFITN